MPTTHIAQARLASLGRDIPADYVGWSDAEILRVRTTPDMVREFDCGLVLRAGDEDRIASFVMSSERPVGQFGDVVIVKGWNLVDFKKRGQPLLWGHNIHEMAAPIGRMKNVSKHGALADGTPALVGDAQFTPPGLSEKADEAFELIRAKFLRGGSVGFRIIESRAPTAEELETTKGLRKYSFIATKTSLIEFSVVPLGMDADATVVSVGGKGKSRTEFFDAGSWISDDSLAGLIDDALEESEDEYGDRYDAVEARLLEDDEDVGEVLDDLILAMYGEGEAHPAPGAAPRVDAATGAVFDSVAGVLARTVVDLSDTYGVDSEEDEEDEDDEDDVYGELLESIYGEDL